METLARKEMIDELKTQWKSLWRERVDDKVRAEGIANKDYSALFIDKGTVIFATRSFKLLNFGDILELHCIDGANGIIPPNPNVGGWGKFIRTKIASQRLHRRTARAWQYSNNEKQHQHLKKGGRGWLHL